MPGEFEEHLHVAGAEAVLAAVREKDAIAAPAVRPVDLEDTPRSPAAQTPEARLATTRLPT
jgi:hypothetical protein